jgi:hypothetical protein
VVIAGLTLTCCGARVGGSEVTATPHPATSSAPSESPAASPPTTATAAPETPSPTPATPPPTASVAPLTPQPSPTPSPPETYSFAGTSDGDGTVSYSGPRIFEMTVTASWSFHCYVNTPPTDPFDLNLPDGQHQWAYGFGGSGSTHFLVGYQNFPFNVTALPGCNWTLTGTLTPEVGA